MAFEFPLLILVSGTIGLCKSQEYASKSLDDPPVTLEELVNSGNSFFSQKLWRKAIPFYSKTIEILSTDGTDDHQQQKSSKAFYYVQRAKCFTELKKSQEALLDFKTAVSIDVNSVLENETALALVKLAKEFSCSRDQEYPDAIWCYDTAIRVLEHDVSYLKMRAECHLQKGNVDLAVEDYRESLKKDPLKKNYRIRLVDILYQNEKYAEALAELVSVRDPWEIVKLGDKFRERNLYKKASSCYTAAISIDRDNSDAYKKRAFCLEKLGHKKEAQKDLEKVDVLAMK